MTNNDILLTRYKQENNLDNSLQLLTYGKWKQKGYTVNKGEKCKHKLALFTLNKKDNGIIKKMCYLFDNTQVTKMEV